VGRQQVTERKADGKKREQVGRYVSGQDIRKLERLAGRLLLQRAGSKEIGQAFRQEGLQEGRCASAQAIRQEIGCVSRLADTLYMGQGSKKAS